MKHGEKPTSTVGEVGRQKHPCTAMCRIFERGGRGTQQYSTTTYVHTSLRCFHGAVGGAGRWGLLYDGASYGGASYGADDGVTACCGTSLAGPLAGWVPLAPQGVAGAALGARLRTQTFEVLRAPLGAVYTVGPESWTPSGPHNQLPVWISSTTSAPGCRARRRGSGGGCDL